MYRKSEEEQLSDARKFAFTALFLAMAVVPAIAIQVFTKTKTEVVFVPATSCLPATEPEDNNKERQPNE